MSNVLTLTSEKTTNQDYKAVINFQNAHLVAESMVKLAPETAKALYQELKVSLDYWNLGNSECI